MDCPATILIVDDEPAVRRLLRRLFETEQYGVLEATNGEEALAAIREHTVDLMTLDLNLNGEDGLDVARCVRSISDVAIIMVSGKGDLIDTVVGLEVGADDYIAKPFELREVLARVRSVLRRTRIDRSDAPPALERTPPTCGDSGSKIAADVIPPAAHAHHDAHVWRFAGCTLDPLARELRGTDGADVALTTAEFELLHLFVRHGRRALTRDAIMDALKGTDWNPSDRTIDNHVARLRRKLEQGGAPRTVKTIRGVGYQLAAAATRVPADV